MQSFRVHFLTASAAVLSILASSPFASATEGSPTLEGKPPFESCKEVAYQTYDSCMSGSMKEQGYLGLFCEMLLQDDLSKCFYLLPDEAPPEAPFEHPDSEPDNQENDPNDSDNGELDLSWPGVRRLA